MTEIKMGRYIRYIWLAIDRETREIVGCYVGDRTRRAARKLWESLPLSIDNVP